MNITLGQIHDWFDKFYDDVIEQKKIVRKYVFCGAHIELHDRKVVTILMTPGLMGQSYDIDERCASMMKNIFDDRTLICEIPTERFEKIVLGEDSIKEEDWFWNDEE